MACRCGGSTGDPVDDRQVVLDSQGSVVRGVSSTTEARMLVSEQGGGTWRPPTIGERDSMDFS